MINYSSDNCKITIIHQYTMFRQLLELIESIVDDDEDEEEFQAQKTCEIKTELTVDTQKQERNIFGSVAECQITTSIRQEASTPTRAVSSTMTARRLLITNNNKNTPATPTSRRLLFSSTVAERAKNRAKKAKEYEMSDSEEEGDSSDESS